MMKKYSCVAILFLAWIVSRPVTTWACSVCFTGTSDAVTDGFNASVLFLMATPYAVVSAIVGGLVFAYRRALRKRAQAETDAIEHFAWMQEDTLR